jgi:hypothetical protein
MHRSHDPVFAEAEPVEVVAKFRISPKARFRRFLVLGSENPIYCSNSSVPGLESVLALRELLDQGKGVECVETIVAYACEGRVAKQDNLTFALAYCARFGDKDTRAKAYEVLGRVCGIPTSLFSFLEFFKTFGVAGESKKWGRMHRRGIATWYTAQPATRLAMQMTKYANRNGWMHRDVLRLCHAVPASRAQNACFAFACSNAKDEAKPAEAKPAEAKPDEAKPDEAKPAEAKPDEAKPAEAKPDEAKPDEAKPAERARRKRRLPSAHAEAPIAKAKGRGKSKAAPEAPVQPAAPAAVESASAPVAPAPAPAAPDREVDEEQQRVETFLAAVGAAKKCETGEQLAALIRAHRLVREHCPTTLLGDACVWEALLENMPLMALIRNLNKLTSVGLLSEGSAHVAGVVARLTDEEQLWRARIHPFNALIAHHTYALGHGERGSLTWSPTPAIVEALEAAFHKCFKHLEPINKRIVFGLDVSGSMCSGIMDSPLSSREAAAALLLTCLRQVPSARVMAFSDSFIELPITADTPLGLVVSMTREMPFTATDCAQPMLWASANGVEADAFVVLTDNETNYGETTPAKALRDYRTRSGIADAKLVVFATANTPFTIADPSDANMLDMAGLDSNTPVVLADFLADKLLADA